MRIVVKRANILDVPSIHQLNNDCLPICYSIIEYGYFIITPQYEVIIAVNDKNKIIGYLLGEYQDNKNFHIMSFGVDKNNRKLGIGTIMINRTGEIIKKHCNTMSLFVHVENVHAIKTYAKTQFIIDSVMKDYYKDSLKADKSYDGYKMIKTID